MTVMVPDPKVAFQQPCPMLEQTLWLKAPKTTLALTFACVIEINTLRKNTFEIICSSQHNMKATLQAAQQIGKQINLGPDLSSNCLHHCKRVKSIC